MEVYSARVEPSWIDYNGHINVAYYHLAFDRATDRFLQRIGLGEEYVVRQKGSMFALEDHLAYVEQGAASGQGLDADGLEIRHFRLRRCLSLQPIVGR